MANYCIDCEKEISKNSTRYIVCSNKSEERRVKQRKRMGKKNSNYKDGKYCGEKKYPGCGKVIANKSNYCGACSRRRRSLNYRYGEVCKCLIFT